MQDAPLAFHPLTFVPERDGVMVGRPDIESYAVLPEDGARLLRVLTDGTPVTAAADWYESTFGELIDMDDFVATLTDLGFVRRPGEEETKTPPVRLQVLGKALFSPVAWVCYALAVVATVILIVRSPELRPRWENVFFVPYLIAVQMVVMLFGTMSGTVLHEWFHVMAGRKRGLPSRVGISDRGLIVAVLETNLKGLLSLPRRQRYVPFIAGIVADVTYFCGLTLAAAALRNGPHWLWQMLLALAYINLLRVAGQLCLFMRTDPYYVLTTALGCTDLAGAASAYLRNKLGWKRSWRLRTDDNAWTPRDMAMAPWFTLLNAVGIVLLAIIAAFGAIPLAIEFFRRLAVGFSHYGVTSLRFWDSAAVLAILILSLIGGSKATEVVEGMLRAGRHPA